MKISTNDNEVQSSERQLDNRGLLENNMTR